MPTDGCQDVRDAGDQRGRGSARKARADVPGRNRVQNLTPSTDPRTVVRELAITSECATLLAAGQRFGFSGIEDPEPAFARLQVRDTSLDPLQVLVLERLISVATGVRGLFRDPEELREYPELSAVSRRVPDLRRLLESISGRILPGGEVDDSASPGLRTIRREIGDARNRIFRSLEGILKAQPLAVQDDIVTFRNGRFVIPIRSDSRGMVPGVVHGLSSSGKRPSSNRSP